MRPATLDPTIRRGLATLTAAAAIAAGLGATASADQQLPDRTRYSYECGHLGQPCDAGVAASGLRLSVNVHRVRAGRLAHLRFHVTTRTIGGARHSVARAAIRFAGGVVRTDRHGRVTVHAIFGVPGRIEARARKIGLGRDTTVIRVLRAR